MATYFNDFEEYTTGVIPSDWTARINANDTWTVETTGSDKYLRLNDPDSNQYLSWDDIDADADRDDVEVLFKWERTSASASVKPTAFGRASGNSSAFSMYRCGGSGTTWQIYKAVSTTSFTSIGSQAFTHSVDTYWVRFQINGTTIRARIWEDGVEEPTSWTGSGTGWAAVTGSSDSDITAAGWVGVGQVASNGSQGAFWQVGVGTNGDTAPTSGYSAVAFSGTVPTLNGQRKAAFSESVAAYFSGTETPFAYSVQSGSLPAGLSLNSSTGVISGTPTATGTASGIVIRATDDDSNTADTNSFTIAIAAATVPDLSDVAITGIDADGGVISVDVVF